MTKWFNALFSLEGAISMIIIAIIVLAVVRLGKWVEENS